MKCAMKSGGVDLQFLIDIRIEYPARNSYQVPGVFAGILIGYLIRVRVGGARSSRARPGTGFENSFTALQAFYPELTSPGVGLQPLCSPV